MASNADLPRVTRHEIELEFTNVDLLSKRVQLIRELFNTKIEIGSEIKTLNKYSNWLFNLFFLRRVDK